MRILLHIIVLIGLLSFGIPTTTFAQKSKTDTKEQIEFYLQRASEIKTTNADSALIYTEKVIEWSRKNKDAKLEVEASFLISDIYYFKNEREKGFEYMVRALEVCENNDLEFEKIEVYYSIGLHYSRSARKGDETIDVKKMQKALNYHKKGIELSEKLNLPVKVSKGYNLSGVCLSRLGQNEKALASYMKSEEYSRAADDSVGLGYTLDYMGGLLTQMGRYDKAENMLLEALEIRKLLKDTFAFAVNLNNMGEFYYQLENDEKALQYLKESFQISFAKPYHDLALHTSGLLATIYETMKEYELAYELKKQEAILMDKLYNLNRSKTLEEMEAKYESELKEKQIAQQDLKISKQNSQLIITISVIVLLILVVYFVYSRQKSRQQHLRKEMELNEKLAAQEMLEKIQSERLRLSRDLHDSLGAELTLITSAADGNAYESRSETDKSSYEKIATMSRNAVSILRDTIWAIRKDALDADEFTAKLMQYISQRQGKMGIEIENHIDESIMLTPSQSLHLFRVCQEVIHNAIKHAEASELKIVFDSNEKQILLTLTDNGKGFEKSDSGGYGLGNMKERISEINGSIEVSSQLGQGTKVVIEVPREL